ncbi:MAG: hydrogenase maturation protease [Anaerolineae bacterium]|nr:hydrogenase maturation protease [Anaerolineae bacterium]
MRPILILGLGNPLQGDDGIGCRVAEALADCALPSDVEVMDGGTPGIGLLHLLEGRRRAILIDAAEMGRPAGTVVRFRPAEIVLTGAAGRFSLHRTAVADALALAAALNLPLPEIVFYGVQPGRVGWGEALSPEVAAAIPIVVERIIAEI